MGDCQISVPYGLWGPMVGFIIGKFGNKTAVRQNFPRSSFLLLLLSSPPFSYDLILPLEV